MLRDFEIQKLFFPVSFFSKIYNNDLQIVMLAKYIFR